MLILKTRLFNSTLKSIGSITTGALSMTIGGKLGYMAGDRLGKALTKDKDEFIAEYLRANPKKNYKYAQRAYEDRVGRFAIGGNLIGLGAGLGGGIYAGDKLSDLLSKD